MSSFLALRATVLFAVLTILSWMDLRWRSADSLARSSKKFVYQVVLISGFLGGCFGVVMDQITCTISEDYFRVFKEIPGDGSMELRLGVASLGFAAGMVPGLIAGLSLAATASTGMSSPILSVRKTLSYLAIPVCAFVVLAPFFAWLHLHWDPMQQRRVFETGFGLSRTNRMLGVWGIHQAAYFGGVLGTLIAVGMLLRRRVSRH